MASNSRAAQRAERSARSHGASALTCGFGGFAMRQVLLDAASTTNGSAFTGIHSRSANRKRRNLRTKDKWPLHRHTIDRPDDNGNVEGRAQNWGAANTTRTTDEG